MKLRSALQIAKLLLEGESVSGLDFSGLISAVTGTITPTQILAYMGTIVAAGVGIYLAWVFGRKAVSSVLNAIRGKKPRV